MIQPDLVFLLDVDNTLLDNDRAKDEIARAVLDLVGVDGAREFWDCYEAVRRDRTVVDFVETLARFHASHADAVRYPELAATILGFPYTSSLYPRVLDTIAHLRKLGTVAVLSDGDPVFQPAKIARAGIAQAVNGHVLVYGHKDEHLDQVVALFPAHRYVFVDDRAHILGLIKASLGDSARTVHIPQGKYATEPGAHGVKPDLVFPAISSLLVTRRSDFL